MMIRLLCSKNIFYSVITTVVQNKNQLVVSSALQFASLFILMVNGSWTLVRNLVANFEYVELRIMLSFIHPFGVSSRALKLSIFDLFLPLVREYR